VLLAAAALANPAAVAADTRTDELAALINRARTDRGLSPLARSPLLDAAATAHSGDMVAHNFLDHTGSDGSTPRDRATRVGYELPADDGSRLVVEVISAISGEPEGPLNWWLNESPDVHGKVLLDPRWQEMGVGYAAGGEYGHYWTVLVGNAGVTAAPTPSIASSVPSPSVTSSVPTPSAVSSVPTPRVTSSVPTLIVASSSQTSGGDIEVRWSGLASAHERDWIGLYRPGSLDGDYETWVYVSCAREPLQPRSSGWCWLRIPSSVPSGTYELRLHGNDRFERVATSAPIGVTHVEATTAPELSWR